MISMDFQHQLTFRPSTRLPVCLPRGWVLPNRRAFECRRQTVLRHATTQHQQALASQLTGQLCLQRQVGRTIIPMLMPQEDGLPFAAAIEVIDDHCPSTSIPSIPSQEAYELHHVLSGSGKVVDQFGNQQEVSAGDSLLIQYGAAALFPTGPTSTAHANASPTEPLVALKLLIPSELLSDTPDHQVSKHTASRIASTWGEPTLPLSPEAASSILSMASAGIRTGTSTPQSTQKHTYNAQHPLHPSRLIKHVSRVSSNLLHTLANLVPSAQHAPSLHHTSAVEKRSMQDLLAFQLPNQTNKLALAFGPDDVGLRLSFGVEIFQPDHRTPPHVHNSAHELFFVLLGQGEAFCNGKRFGVSQGDLVVFPPTSVHGVDNLAGNKLYCLQIMLPNEMFVEFVKSGKAVGRLDDEDLCNLIAVGCSSM